MILTIIGRRFIRDRFTYSASALTYTTLLSLVPITAVVFGLLSLVPQFRQLGDKLQNFIFANFVPATGQMVQQYLNQFATQAGRLPITGFVVLVVLVVMMILTVERTLNDIWRISYRRRGWASGVRFWVIVILTPLLAALAIAIVTYLISTPFVANTLGHVGLLTIVTFLIPFLLTLIALTVVYSMVPNCQVPFKYAFLGAVVGAILIQVAKFLFFLYITKFPTYQFLYGALATIPIFLLWMYLTWVIVLLGSLVSNVLTVHSYRRGASRVSAFAAAILWLQALWQAQQQGEVLSILNLYETASDDHGITPELQLQVMIDAGLIKMLGRSRVMLARNMGDYKLSDLYRDLPWKLSNTGLAKVSESLNQDVLTIEKSLFSQLDQKVILADMK